MTAHRRVTASAARRALKKDWSTTSPFEPELGSAENNLRDGSLPSVPVHGAPPLAERSRFVQDGSRTLVTIDGGTEMPHPNADLLRKGYDAFSKGDLDTIKNEVFSPDVVFHVAGRNPLSGDYRGVDEVFGFFGRLFDLSGGTFALELHDVVANDGHAVGLSRLSAQREGKTLDGANGVEVYHVQDGRVTEAWLITEDDYSFDEFWS